MATSDQEQRGINVRQRKRLAQGEKLDGTSLQPKGGSQPASSGSKAGGLSHASKKK
jgi:hypothetical protein